MGRNSAQPRLTWSLESFTPGGLTRTSIAWETAAFASELPALAALSISPNPDLEALLRGVSSVTVLQRRCWMVQWASFKASTSTWKDPGQAPWLVYSTTDRGICCSVLLSETPSDCNEVVKSGLGRSVEASLPFSQAIEG